MAVKEKTITNNLTTRVFDDIIEAYVSGKRRSLLEGGTYSTKTYSALQALLYIASVATEPMLISIVSESLPHMKQGAMKDFFTILGEQKESNPYFHMTESRYAHPDWKGVFEFFGADSEGKAIGPRRDILFINEGNNVPWETARHLDGRTEMFTIVDWNPTAEFWAHEYWKDDPEGRNAYSHSTYQDAVTSTGRPVISPEKVKDIEAYRDKDPNWWNIYGLGLLGKVTGLVHPYFAQIDELPEGHYFYGLDFGFGSYDPIELIGGDPTVLTKNVIIGDNLYSQQLIYTREPMTNDDIARQMALLHVGKVDPIYPDPNEPKSAEELRQKGFNVEATEKGPGSVKYGIQRVNEYYQFWTKDSVDCIKDQRNYKYISRKDSTGRQYLSEDTTHAWSHGMDSRRYGVASFVFSTGKIKSKRSMRL